MGADFFFPILTFAGGVLLLLGWLYATAANPRSNALLLKSIGFFVLPGIALVEVPQFALRFPLASLFWPLVEEALKSAAAVTEKNPRDRFWLVTLFGVWELMLAKAVWGITHRALLETWTDFQLVGLAVAALLAVLMHAITAEIYAFRFTGRLTAAIAASWAVHASFNKSIDLLGVSLTSALLLLLPLVLLFMGLWPRQSPTAASETEVACR